MAFCSEPGCDRQRNVKGLCSTHYQRQLRPATERSTALKEIDKLLEPRDARREYQTSGATLICYRLGSGHGTQLLRFETLSEALECDAQADCSHGCQHQHTLVVFTPDGVRCLSTAVARVRSISQAAAIGAVYPKRQRAAFGGGGALGTRAGAALGIWNAVEPDELDLDELEPDEAELDEIELDAAQPEQVKPKRPPRVQTAPADPVLAGVGDLAVIVTMRLTWKRVQPRRLSRRQRKQAKH